MPNTLQLRFSSVFNLTTQTIDAEADGADGVSQANVDVASGATDLQIAFPFDKDTGLLLVIVSDRALTVKTNSSGSPANTFVLTANVPLLWYPGCGYSLAADITALYVTNASGGAAKLKIRASQDITP